MTGRFFVCKDPNGTWQTEQSCKMQTGHNNQGGKIMKRVAYSGIEGAFAHVAARKLFPDGLHVSYGDFTKTYEAVVNGECDLAVLPVRNSIAGEVAEVQDLLATGRLFVSEEIDLPIVQNLLGVRGSRIGDIKKVVSQQKAIEQCSNYIAAKGYEIMTAVNTAVAAREVTRKQDLSVAAIASMEVAALYGLKVLDEHINDRDDNITSFVALSRKEGRNDHGNDV